MEFRKSLVHHTLSRRMFLTSELMYALWEEVPKLVYYRLICKPVSCFIESRDLNIISVPLRAYCDVITDCNLYSLETATLG